MGEGSVSVLKRLGREVLYSRVGSGVGLKRVTRGFACLPESRSSLGRELRGFLRSRSGEGSELIEVFTGVGHSSLLQGGSSPLWLRGVLKSSPLEQFWN